jgi:hypothetical protein
VPNCIFIKKVYFSLCSGITMKLIFFNMLYVTFLLFRHLRFHCVWNISYIEMLMRRPWGGCPAHPALWTALFYNSKTTLLLLCALCTWKHKGEVVSVCTHISFPKLLKICKWNLVMWSVHQRFLHILNCGLCLCNNHPFSQKWFMIQKNCWWHKALALKLL